MSAISRLFRRLRIAFAAFSIPGLLGAAPAMAENVARLLFVDPSGNYRGMTVDVTGHLVNLQSGLNDNLASLTTLVSTPSGFVGYSASGGGTLFRMDPEGDLSGATHVGFSAGWASLIPLGNSIFFYGTHIAGEPTPVGALVSINPDLSTTQTDTLTGLAQWTQVATTDDSYVLYNSTTGIAAAMIIVAQQKLIQTDSEPLMTGANLLGSSGDVLMPYNKKTGDYQIVDVDVQGGLVVEASGSIAKGYGNVASSNGFLLYYNPGSGSTRIGYIDRTPATCCRFVTTQTSTQTPGWTNVLAAGQYVFFYSTSTAQLLVATIAAGGKLVPIDSTTLVANTPPFTLVAAIAR
jgi:hypothetical protein